MKYGMYKDVQALLKEEVVEILADFLSSIDPDEIKYALKASHYMMEQCRRTKGFKMLIGDFDAFEGVDKVMKLLTHPNEKISKLADYFIKTYLDVYEVPENFESNYPKT